MKYFHFQFRNVKYIIIPEEHVKINCLISNQVKFYDFELFLLELILHASKILLWLSAEF